MSAVKKTKKKKIGFKNRVKTQFKLIIDYFSSWRFVVFLWVLFVWLCISYVFLFFAAARIETLITFPGRDINLKEIINHPAGLLVAEKVEYTSSAGNKITGLYIDNESEKVVYYFHGNGAPLEYFYSDIQYISNLGYSVIALEYPWYAESTGLPYLEENRDVTKIFYENMKQKLWFQEENLIIWWYSIWTALAVDFAQEKDFDSLVLFSPLASRYDVSEDTFWFPLQKLFFLPNSYISKESIKDIDEPTLIIHGNIDKVVSFRQWKLVYDNSPADKKYFIEIDGFGHSLIPERYGEALRGYIENFLKNYALEQKELFLTPELATKLLSKYQKEKRIKNLDLISDDSYTKYVDPSVSFTQRWYVPEDMRRLDRTHIIDTKWNAQLREKAAEAFEALAEDFYADRGEKVTVVSTYRSYNYQAGIKARGCPDNLCAKAGHSEHQSWLWIDVWSASSQAYWDSSPRLTSFYEWFDEYAHLYGYHNPYKNGREVDGYDIEPWHWRYLGIEFASYLHEKDITFAQHYYKK